MNPYCPACGHKLDRTDERGVSSFIDNEHNQQKYVCNRIDCMNVMLDYDYLFLGIVKKELESNTCEGDCA